MPEVTKLHLYGRAFRLLAEAISVLVFAIICLPMAHVNPDFGMALDDRIRDFKQRVNDLDRDAKNLAARKKT